jgi:hypothetical protein
MALANVDDFIVFDATAATMHCYSMKTGAELWETPSFGSSPWASTYTIYTSETNDLSNLYLAFPDGAMRAYSLTDGHLIWTSTPFASTEYPNNAVPVGPSGGLVLVDGKLYVYMGYSLAYQINPVPRFAMTVCINATTGDIIFTLNGGVAPSAAANGYVIGSSLFDGNLYSLGKGQTSTAVTASPKVSAQGSSVLIEGSVMDMSPASPNTPAVSDADMSEWMDYLHMQNATLLNNPSAPKGVTVKLVAIGPNGDVIDIGTVTSDSGGLFKKMWTPKSDGEYTVYATFDGSNSYYGSYAETALSVGPAPQAPTEGPTAAPDNTMTIIGTGIGVGIAVIIAVAVATVLMLRRKP